MKKRGASFSIFLLSMVVLSGCSIDVKKANAPSDPPKVGKSTFTASQVVGHFSAGAPVMFLWPMEKENESGDLVPLTFSEQAEVRKNIVRASEEKAFFETQFFDTEAEINKKYDTLSRTLEQEYIADLCYTLCDPFELSCIPDEPETLFQDAWKETEDPAEQAQIARCIENEDERRGLDAKKEQEVAEVLDPLEEQMIAANRTLLATVGNRNFFNDLRGLELSYGAVNSCEELAVNCLDIAAGDTGLIVKVLFVGGGFTNALHSNLEFTVSDVNFDLEDGFITFKIPAIDFAVGPDPYGEIFFDLELNPNGNELSIGGDIQLTTFATGETRIGRISASGPINPITR